MLVMLSVNRRKDKCDGNSLEQFLAFFNAPHEIA